MQYLMLIYENEKVWTTISQAEAGAIFGDYVQLTRSLTQSGHYQGGNPLEPTHTATTVRTRDGKVQTTDGPFAETREQLGGYFVIEAKDLDEAIGIAARIPASATGSVEIRPVRPRPPAA